MPKQNFQSINAGFNTVFKPNKLSFGLVAPLEAYLESPVPTMERHLEKAKLAEELGFSAIWLRDVPFNVPTFGDAGQTFDPWVYLGFLAAQTSKIALCTGSIILPLRHPAHTAKAAASVDQLSGGRLILGVASGDRPEEYPAMNMEFHDRGERFQDAFFYIKKMAEDFPVFENRYGQTTGYIDMLPKPTGSVIPLLITGGSRQHPDWVAKHSDGWITYPRSARDQKIAVEDYRGRIKQADQPDKPISQSLYVDLLDNANADPTPIHLGFRSGVNFLLSYLKELEKIGINHVVFNLRFNQANIEETMGKIAKEIIPNFK